jgi:hypothetical protein
MKVIATAILLFFANITVVMGTANAIETSAKSLPIPNMVALHREHVKNRMLQVGQQCVSSTDALYTNQVLSDATSAWEAELRENACDPDFGSTTIECFTDSTALISHGSVVEACQEAGGESILVNVHLFCDFNAQGADISYDIVMENLPTCFDASSCDVSGDGDLASLFGDEVEGLTQVLGECNVSVSEGSGAVHIEDSDADDVLELPSESPSAVSSSAPSSSIDVSSSIPTSLPSEAPSAAPTSDPTGGGGGKAETTSSSAFHINLKISGTLGVISAVVVAVVSFWA